MSSIYIKQISYRTQPLSRIAIHTFTPCVPRATGSVHIRILKHKWVSAFAQGQKWVEIQKYMKHNLNAMRFAKPGTWILLGTSKQITALAICSGAAMRQNRDVAVLQDPGLLHETLHGDVREYSHRAITFLLVAYAT